MLTAIAQLDTAPAEEPVTVAEAKEHLRVDFADDDTYIGSLISAARQQVEQETNRKLVTQTWTITAPEFADPILLPFGPLQSVTSITYYDSANAQQTLSTDVYEVNTQSMAGQVHLGYAQVWPTTYQRHDAVTVTYVVGYGAATAVPEALKQCILLLVGNYYEHREPVSAVSMSAVPRSVDYLMSTYRVMW